MIGKVIAGLVAVSMGLYSTYVTQTAPGELVMTVEPDVESTREVTAEEMECARAVIRLKLDGAGLIEVKVKEGEGKQIIIDAPSTDMKEAITKAVCEETAGLQFLDNNGNVLMEGTSEYISSAESTYGNTWEYGNNFEHYVSISFTPAGREKFKEITRMAVDKTADGGNIIAIAVGGVVYSSPIVAEVIDSDSCIVTGNFDKEAADELANVINAGRLNFGFKIVE